MDGGATQSDFLMQFQADILGIPVERPVITEMAALGAAYLAGLGVGFWESREELESKWKVEKVYEPQHGGGPARRALRRLEEGGGTELQVGQPMSRRRPAGFEGGGGRR